MSTAPSSATSNAPGETSNGLHVLRTNTALPLLEVAIRYRELWKVEAIFRTTKAVLQARPVYHSSDAAIRGHLFCCFLALTLHKELQGRLKRSASLCHPSAEGTIRHPTFSQNRASAPRKSS